MRVDILTLFPKMFEGPFSHSLLFKAQEKGLFSLNILNIRDFTSDKHRTADDTPYGGGPGMVMKAEPVGKAIKSLNPDAKTRIILMCPTGTVLNQKKAQELSESEHLIIICCH